MIELVNISGGYRRGLDVIGGISVTFPPGRITCVVGANGSGKSTLLALACGRLKPGGGKALLDGQELSSLSRPEIARRISYLPQIRTMPSITVETLVLHGRFPYLGYPRVYREADRAVARAAMERAGILACRKKMLAKLSGGERQKAYIAMLLAQDTGTVLLDEPTTYLDIAHQIEMVGLLRELRAEGKAVAVVLHDLNMALRCSDTMAVMRAGRLLAWDTPERVLASGALEQAFGISISEERQYGFSIAPQGKL
jgi:iron complex transport system ATP-binding protein